MSPSPLPVATYRRRRRATPRLQLVEKPAPVVSLPVPSISPWLRWLTLLQKVSTALCLLAIASVLGVYAASVYTSSLWSREYEYLQTLQHQEREAVSANEIMKEQLAREASKQDTMAIGKVKPIFLPPAKERPLKKTTPSAALAETTNSRPLGY